jgi:hypothetical protein
MDEATDPFAELTRRGHLLFGAAVQAWQEATRSMLDAAGHPDRGSPDLRRSIDAAFDFADQMLAEQQEFARAVMSLGAQAFPSTVVPPGPSAGPAPTAASRAADDSALPVATQPEPVATQPAPEAVPAATEPKAARPQRKAAAQKRTPTTRTPGSTPRKKTPRKAAAAATPTPTGSAADETRSAPAPAAAPTDETRE